MKIATLILSLILIVSCKNQEPNKKNIEVTKIKKEYKDNEIEDALYNGNFIKNKKGFDVAINKNNLYLLKQNASNKDKNTPFFLEVKTGKTVEKTLEFSTIDFAYNHNLSDNFNNVTVLKYPLLKNQSNLDILIGQFNEKGRTWHTYISNNTEGITYKNEYVENTNTNRYLQEFEYALDDGYFIEQNEHYDLLIDQNIIYYIKNVEKNIDIQTQLYLHINYENVAERLNISFNPKDIMINQFLGEKYKKLIVLKKEIPENGAILKIGTGQFNAQGRLWGTSFDMETLYTSASYIYKDQYKN